MKVGQIAPRKTACGLRQRSWWVMRRHGVFTLTELLSTLATGTERAASNNLSKYLRALVLSGILTTEGRTPASKNNNGCLRYRVVVDNGRKAPVWRQRSNEVYDPNMGIAYPIGGDHE